jgi:hypothetical protein
MSLFARSLDRLDRGCNEPSQALIRVARLQPDLSFAEEAPSWDVDLRSGPLEQR